MCDAGVGLLILGSDVWRALLTKVEDASKVKPRLSHLALRAEMRGAAANSFLLDRLPANFA